MSTVSFQRQNFVPYSSGITLKLIKNGRLLQFVHEALYNIDWMAEWGGSGMSIIADHICLWKIESKWH